MDRKIIHSRGVGMVWLLSESGYFIIIHDVLFVPLLAVNLFAANRFAREHHNTHSEVMEYSVIPLTEPNSGLV